MVYPNQIKPTHTRPIMEDHKTGARSWFTINYKVYFAATMCKPLIIKPVQQFSLS